MTEMGCNKLRVQFNNMSNVCHKKLFGILFDLHLLIFLGKGVVSIVTATLHITWFYTYDTSETDQHHKEIYFSIGHVKILYMLVRKILFSAK